MAVDLNVFVKFYMLTIYDDNVVFCTSKDILVPISNALFNNTVERMSENVEMTLTKVRQQKIEKVCGK